MRLTLEAEKGDNEKPRVKNYLNEIISKRKKNRISQRIMPDHLSGLLSIPRLIRHVTTNHKAKEHKSSRSQIVVDAVVRLIATILRARVKTDGRESAASNRASRDGAGRTRASRVKATFLK